MWLAGAATTFLERLKKWLLGWLHGGPHFVVGDPARPYMLRWYILPRNPLLNVYLHKFVRDDDDRALHDHPWPSVSVLLKGRYLEQMHGKNLLGEPGIIKVMRSWQWWSLFGIPIVFRRATHRHRIELIDGDPAWTLFVTGPVVRDWGFWCPKGFVPWQKFVEPNAPGQVGRGCDAA